MRSNPVGKRRTQSTVEILRTAEKNLDLFWQKVDETVECGAKARGITGTAV